MFMKATLPEIAVMRSESYKNIIIDQQESQSEVELEEKHFYSEIGICVPSKETKSIKDVYLNQKPSLARDPLLSTRESTPNRPHDLSSSFTFNKFTSA